MFDPQFSEKIGLSEKQKRELSRRLLEDEETVEKKHLRLGQSLRDNEKQSLAVITPKQWEQLEQILANYAGNCYPGINFENCITRSSPNNWP